MAVAGLVRLRKQSLLHGHGAGTRRGRAGYHAQGGGLSRHGRGGGRDGCRCRRGCRPAGGERGPRNQPALSPGVPHLPFSRALDVRCAALSHEAGNRDMAQAGPDRSAPLLARAIRADACRGNQQDRGRNRGRNRCRRRLCRGGNLGARRGTGTLRDHGSGAAMNSAATPPKPQRMTYREACKQAIRAAILADPRVFLMGEDVARYGGSYAVTKGLAEELGEEKIRDTPLSEAAYVGAGIGAAIAGMRPIVEIMTVNFSLLALDQIVNSAATIPHMSGGQFAVPLVIRMATGAGRQLAAQHSHSLEGWYAHIPGIKVVTPATLEDARGMLWTALEDPDPVLIFEHQTLYNMEGELEFAGAVDIEKARVRRPGRDLSLISYGGSLHKVMEAAEELARSGIDSEVVDLRVLRPLDTETILDSVTRTHRAVIVDEGWRSGSIAAEVSARIMEGAFYELDAPVARVCSAEVPMPYAKHLEDAALPQAQAIAGTVRALMGSNG